MKDFKADITNADAIKLISEAISDNCVDTCDMCKCTEWCDYYKALQKVKIALSVAYVCKGSGDNYPCKHTTDITKAKNFTEVEPGKWMENYNEKEGDQMVYPQGTVKSVSIIDDDGNLKFIPLDRVIIERR